VARLIENTKRDKTQPVQGLRGRCLDVYDVKTNVKTTLQNPVPDGRDI